MECPNGEGKPVVRNRRPYVVNVCMYKHNQNGTKRQQTDTGGEKMIVDSTLREFRNSLYPGYKFLLTKKITEAENIRKVLKREYIIQEVYAKVWRENTKRALQYKKF